MVTAVSGIKPETHISLQNWRFWPMSENVGHHFEHDHSEPCAPRAEDESNSD